MLIYLLQLERTKSNMYSWLSNRSVQNENETIPRFWQALSMAEITWAPCNG